MTLQLNLPPEVEARLQAKARAMGVPVEDFAIKVLERESGAPVGPQRLRSSGIAAHLPVRSSDVHREHRTEVESEERKAA